MSELAPQGTQRARMHAARACSITTKKGTLCYLLKSPLQGRPKLTVPSPFAGWSSSEVVLSMRSKSVTPARSLKVVGAHRHSYARRVGRLIAAPGVAGEVTGGAATVAEAVQQHRTELCCRTEATMPTRKVRRESAYRTTMSVAPEGTSGASLSRKKGGSGLRLCDDQPD